MPRLAPISWRRLVRVFKAAGFRQVRVRGSHVILENPGIARPVVIPKYPLVDVVIIQANLRTAGMSRERYFELLAQA